MIIGVGVEGPSDRTFWDKVLHKHFRGTRFDIRAMNNREKLMRETPRLLATFRDAHYDAGFIVLDRDKTSCVPAVVDEFDPESKREARLPAAHRFLFICVAVRELEAWFLADDTAVKKVLSKAIYHAPIETGALGAEGKLLDLWRQQYGARVAFNKIDFARKIAPEFVPDRAAAHSQSFKYFWNSITPRATKRSRR